MHTVAVLRSRVGLTVALAVVASSAIVVGAPDARAGGVADCRNGYLCVFVDAGQLGPAGNFGTVNDLAQFPRRECRYGHWGDCISSAHNYDVNGFYLYRDANFNNRNGSYDLYMPPGSVAGNMSDYGLNDVVSSIAVRTYPV